jgi:hypothetical protein
VKITYVVVLLCFFLLYTSYARNKGGMCYTTKCDTVKDGSIECALKGNPCGYGG